MSKLYSTDSFFRDISPNTNQVSEKLLVFSRKIRNFVKKIIDSDIEVSVVEILLKIPGMMLILFLGLIITIALLNMSEPENGYRIVPIISGSMSPSIKPGSVAFIIPDHSSKVGDIVSFKEKSTTSGNYTGRILAHRIVEQLIKKDDKYFITKGDANSAPDPGYVTKQDIIGKVSIVVPYLGYVSYISLSQWGILFFILIPAILLIRSETTLIKKLLLKGSET
jgi:signal peptidase I